MTTRFLSLLSPLPLLAAGCLQAADSSDVVPEDPSGLGKADQISGNDDPSGLLGDAERRLASLVTGADIGQSFGVPDELVPYPDTYWPMVDDGIAVEWLEKDGSKCFSPNDCDDPAPSPLAKLVGLTDPTRVEEAVTWEIENHGSAREGVADWWGHCPGWVASAMLYPPVQGPVSVKRTAFGFEKCDADDSDCTTFEIGDINALAAEAHEGAQARFIGARCDTAPTEIERDEFGRIVRNGTGCKGLNAGAMLIVMGNQLKLNEQPFAIDSQNEFTTDQIWNQPAFRYTVNDFQPLSEVEAANLVATGGESRDGDQTEYIFNENAEGFALVDVTLHWVTETFGPNLTVVSGATSSRRTRMLAVIELDGSFDDPEAEIIGGEYLDDPSIGADRLSVAPFAWIALDVGFDFRHNPFVRGSDVKELLGLALETDDSGDDL